MLKEWTPAGFILFKHNVEEPAQVLELNKELTSLIPDATPPLLTVDQEGGRVMRIRDGVTKWPPMMWLGNCAELKLTTAVARAMADELYAMGFNMNWGPVADVNSNPKNPVIGDRAFGDKPGPVSQHVAAWVRATQSRGMMACAKHFPGHGDTSQDSHFHLPIVEKELPDLLEVERKPFEAAVAAGVAAIMTAHVVFPDLEEDYPATMSPRILKGWLREEMGYNGLIISDDLDMKAVRGRFELEEQLDRGCRGTLDIFLPCHSQPMQQAAFEHLVRLQEEHPLHHTLAEDSERRVNAARERFLLNRPAQPPLDVLTSQASKDLALMIRARGEGIA